MIKFVRQFKEKNTMGEYEIEIGKCKAIAVPLVQPVVEQLNLLRVPGSPFALEVQPGRNAQGEEVAGRVSIFLEATTAQTCPNRKEREFFKRQLISPMGLLWSSVRSLDVLNNVATDERQPLNDAGLLDLGGKIVRAEMAEINTMNIIAKGIDERLSLWQISDLIQTR